MNDLQYRENSIQDQFLKFKQKNNDRKIDRSVNNLNQNKKYIGNCLQNEQLPYETNFRTSLTNNRSLITKCSLPKSLTNVGSIYKENLYDKILISKKNDRNQNGRIDKIYPINKQVYNTPNLSKNDYQFQIANIKNIKQVLNCFDNHNLIPPKQYEFKSIFNAIQRSNQSNIETDENSIKNRNKSCLPQNYDKISNRRIFFQQKNQNGFVGFRIKLNFEYPMENKNLNLNRNQKFINQFMYESKPRKINNFIKDIAKENNNVLETMLKPNNSNYTKLLNRTNLYKQVQDQKRGSEERIESNQLERNKPNFNLDKGINNNRRKKSNSEQLASQLKWKNNTNFNSSNLIPSSFVNKPNKIYNENYEQYQFNNTTKHQPDKRESIMKLAVSNGKFLNYQPSQNNLNYKEHNSTFKPPVTTKPKYSNKFENYVGNNFNLKNKTVFVRNLPNNHLNQKLNDQELPLNKSNHQQLRNIENKNIVKQNIVKQNIVKQNINFKESDINSILPKIPNSQSKYDWKNVIPNTIYNYQLEKLNLHPSVKVVETKDQGNVHIVYNPSLPDYMEGLQYIDVKSPKFLY